MTSRKNFLIVLLVFSLYVLIGTAIFHGIELAEELKRIEHEIEQRIHVKEIVKKYLKNKDDKKDLFDALEGYCGKPIRNVTTDVEPKWNFIHSLFFVMTVVSTIGYGNLAPTTMFGRNFMIFYSLVGIPINGFIMLALGEFFGKSFTKLHNRWKNSKQLRQVDPSRLGLVAQIILYLVPGFTFFIFVPSIVISAFEGWDYDVAVYYAFVTLTTIGFGDYVAGADQGDLNYFNYICYQLFLLVWIIGGLGYVFMILNFIGMGMRSEKLQKLEHRIASNIMKTPTRIRHELRSILEEFLMVRVKKVYKEFDYKPQEIERSQSCPDLTIYRTSIFPSTLERKRAFSECQENYILQRIQSDTDLHRIDKELTFQGTDQQADLIIKVVDALSMNEYMDSELGCYEGFSEKEILASEHFDSNWSIPRSGIMAPPLSPFRTRAASDARYPPRPRRQSDNEHTWYGQSYLSKYAKLMKNDKSLLEPIEDVVQKNNPGFFQRIKNSLLSKPDKTNDLEKGIDQETPYQIFSEKRQAKFSTNDHEQVLENTSVADLIRALSAISDQTPSTSQQETTEQNLLKHQRARRMPIKSNFQNRRTSLFSSNMPVTNTSQSLRRSSLLPSLESSRYNNVAPISPRRSSLSPVAELSSPHQETSFPMSPSKIRRFSIRPVAASNIQPTAPQKKDPEDSQ